MDVFFLACVKKAEQRRYRTLGGLVEDGCIVSAQFTSFGDKSIALREGVINCVGGDA